MQSYLLPSIRLTLLMLVFFCGGYTLLVLVFAQAAPGKGEGITISQNGQTYHLNVGQSFSDPQYFWSRPSAVDYNAAGSGGSNKGPSNPEYLAEVENRIDSFMRANPAVERGQIPADLVTASGSGLDPHISVQAALVQIPRIAERRNLDEAQLQRLVSENTEPPLLGLFGTERVHVLKLNLALENL